jgi:hypothetical protein
MRHARRAAASSSGRTSVAQRRFELIHSILAPHAPRAIHDLGDGYGRGRELTLLGGCRGANDLVRFNGVNRINRVARTSPDAASGLRTSHLQHLCCWQRTGDTPALLRSDGPDRRQGPRRVRRIGEVKARPLARSANFGLWRTRRRRPRPWQRRHPASRAGLQGLRTSAESRGSARGAARSGWPSARGLRRRNPRS